MPVFGFPVFSRYIDKKSFMLYLGIMAKKGYLPLLTGLFLSITVIAVSGDDLDTAAMYPPNAILNASYMGDEEVVRDILAAGIDKNIRDDFGDTALHVAIFQKNVTIVKLLLDYGFDPNAIAASNGNTPLHNAVAANNLAAARLLIQYGANKNIKALNGQTPLDMARKEEKTDMVRLLYR